MKYSFLILNFKIKSRRQYPRIKKLRPMKNGVAKISVELISLRPKAELNRTAKLKTHKIDAPKAAVRAICLVGRFWYMGTNIRTPESGSSIFNLFVEKTGAELPPRYFVC